MQIATNKTDQKLLIWPANHFNNQNALRNIDESIRDLDVAILTGLLINGLLLVVFILNMSNRKNIQVTQSLILFHMIPKSYYSKTWITIVIAN